MIFTVILSIIMVFLARSGEYEEHRSNLDIKANYRKLLRSKKKKRKKKVLRTGQRILKTAGSALLLSASLYSLINSQNGQYNIAVGKQYTDSFLKTNGSKKVSDIKPNKDWTWADYAWAEVEKPHQERR